MISITRSLLNCTSRIQICFTHVSSNPTSIGLTSVQQPWSIPHRCLTLPPERQCNIKKRGKFRPTFWKRLHQNGLETALASPAGRRRLFNRLLKGKHNLTGHDSFLAVKPKYAKTKKELRHEVSIPKPLRSRHNA
ncbi:uncharacterized protein LOC132550606 isoform X2 [Ylistrum balloti]|uniref:uncharacterized protein LOC132550606 isoform X2 n=1 Tax=Ylistrum balloti TaxID=509963 RepID=UPI002905C399|nr:uncharacterized protein LOC132550606 isoform X2 [Ylistrum balloti]